MSLASQGKLKAFKVGDNWLTTKKWFSQYQEMIKKSVLSEAASFQEDNSKWVKHVPIGGFRLVLIKETLLVIFILFLISFSLAWLVGSPSGHQFAQASSSAVKSTYQIGELFTVWTDKIYFAGFQSVYFVANRSVVSTYLVFDSLKQFGLDSKTLALAVDDQLSDYKFSDEYATDKIKQFLAGVKNNYQSVAGDSEIREQIYYDEWQKSLNQ